MDKLYRILGKRGRTTIPYPVRQIVGFRQNDILSFTLGEDKKSVTIRREKICTDCVSQMQETEQNVTLEDLLGSLSDEQQMAAFIYLSQNMIARNGGGNSDKT